MVYFFKGNYYNHDYNYTTGYFNNYFLTPGVYYLIIINICIYFLEIITLILPSSWGLNELLINIFALSPTKVIEKFWIWQLITGTFLHDDSGIMHILFNMLTLYFFGHIVERYYGTKKFIILYLLAGFFSSLVYTIFYFVQGIRTLALGASGSIMAILVVSAFLSPTSIVYLYFLFPIKLRTLIWILIGLDIFIVINPKIYGVASIAHLGGALFGFLFYKFEFRFTYLLRELEKREKILNNYSNSKINNVSKFIEEEDLDSIRKRVDEILDKINKKGINSLTPEEKEFLKEASLKFRKNLD